jgi:hypothetical protein
MGLRLTSYRGLAWTIVTYLEALLAVQDWPLLEVSYLSKKTSVRNSVGFFEILLFLRTAVGIGSEFSGLSQNPNKGGFLRNSADSVEFRACSSEFLCFSTAVYDILIRYFFNFVGFLLNIFLCMMATQAFSNLQF